MAPEKKSKYLAGSGFEFDNPDEFTKILLTHGIDKEGLKFFSEIQSATELIIENDRVIEIIEHANGETESIESELELPISQWPERSPFHLHKNKNGIHSVGGKKPEYFELPHSERIKSPFIYLATINGNDPAFNWMNVEKIHIAYPLFEGAFNIFLDYSNPNSPSVINHDVFTYSWMDDNAKGVEKVEYIKQNYAATSTTDFYEKENDDDFLLSGVPLWYQGPQIPRCPKSGEVMRFVTTINSDKNLVLRDTSGIGIPLSVENI